MDTKQLKQKILDLAIRGKLVPQDPNDEPASVLLERIRKEKEQLIASGKLKKSKSKTTDTPHYENVPFEIPDSWEWVRLENVAEIARGGSPRPIKQYLTSSPTGVNWIKIGDTEKGGKYINSCKEKIIADGIKRSRMVHKGDFLLTNSMSFGRPYILNIDGCIHDGWLVISPLQGVYDKEFLFYILSSMYAYDQFSEQASGSSVSNLNIEKVEAALFPIIPIREQKRIVEELEKWFALIDEVESNKQDLQEYIRKVKSQILSLAISGKLVSQDPNDEPAIELLKRINPTFKPCDTLHYENLPEGWAVCRLEDLVDYEQPTQYIVESTEYSNDYKTPVLTPGKSFILGYTNETTGIYDKLPTIIFDDFTTDSRYVDFPFKVKSSAMKILQVHKEINIRYVAYFMSITRLAGDTHKRYWISEYSKIPIPLPPINEQNRIVQTIQDIEAKLNEITAEL